MTCSQTKKSSLYGRFWLNFSHTTPTQTFVFTFYFVLNLYTCSPYTGRHISTADDKMYSITVDYNKNISEIVYLRTVVIK